jgi:hypothetical protein
MIVSMATAFDCLKIIRLSRLNGTKTGAPPDNINNQTWQFGAGNI